VYDDSDLHDTPHLNLSQQHIGFNSSFKFGGLSS